MKSAMLTIFLPHFDLTVRFTLPQAKFTSCNNIKSLRKII